MDTHLASRIPQVAGGTNRLSARTALKDFVVLAGTGKASANSTEFPVGEQEKLAELLESYRLTYLFARLAADTGMADSARRRIQDKAAAVKKRGRVFMEEMAQVLDLFRSRQIPCAPFKGPFLAALLYGDCYARDASDIDILIEPHQAAQVDRLLRDRGYEQDGFEYFHDGNAPECPDFPLQTTSRRGLAGYGRKLDGVDLFIEIHTSVRYLSRAGETAVLMRQKRLDMDGLQVLAPDDECSLLLFLLDKYKDLEHSDFFGLRDIVDIYCCINLLSADVWTRTLALAEQYDCLERVGDVVGALTGGGLDLPVSLGSFWSRNASTIATPVRFPYLNWDILLSGNPKGAWHVGRQLRAKRYLESGPFFTVASGLQATAPLPEEPIPNELGIDLRCRIHLVQNCMAVDVVYPAGTLDFIGSHALRVSLTRPDGEDAYPGRGYVALFDKAGAVKLRYLSGWGLGRPEPVGDGSSAAMLEHGDGHMLRLLMAAPTAAGWIASLPILFEFSLRRSYFAFPGREEFAFYTAGSKGPMILQAE